MRDWLALIIVVLIIGILIDGVRRMRLARKEEIRLSKNAVKADREEVNESLNSEFPSGKARVAKQRSTEIAQELNESVKQKFVSEKTTIGAPQKIPEQVALNLEESVPMLMDSVEVEESKDDSHLEPHLGDLNVDVETEGLESQAEFESESLLVAEKQEQEETPIAESESTFIEPEEVLIINVMAKKGEAFPGKDLLDVFTNLNLKLGEMEIFHRYRDNDGDGPVLFSLANMVVPGTFKLSEMEQFQTPGVSMFLGLPISGVKDGGSLDAYDDLVHTAKTIAEYLGGELKDENRSVMTSQTIEHGRQRVIEFERKQKLASL